MEEFVNIIGTVGFPIFACCVMFWQNNKLQETLKDLTVTLEKMRVEFVKKGKEESEIDN